MKSLYRINRYDIPAGETRTFRSGRRYQILFVTDGACQLTADDQKWLCRSPDMLLIKPAEAPRVRAAGRNAPCSLLCIAVPVETLAALSDHTCNLAESFEFAPYGTCVIHADARASMLLQNMLTKLSGIKDEGIALGTKLYEKSLLATFLVLFLRVCVQNDRIHQSHQRKLLIIDDVFEYISRHLTDDLSLKTLEQEFFVSGEHISREFKKSTGITLHAYITRSRIDLGKKYLLEGICVRDVCQLCGFCSYNHFFKAFKKECGMTPGAYVKSRRQPAEAGAIPGK